jgi:hypothetical protein
VFPSSVRIDAVSATSAERLLILLDALDYEAANVRSVVTIFMSAPAIPRRDAPRPIASAMLVMKASNRW